MGRDQYEQIADHYNSFPQLNILRFRMLMDLSFLPTIADIVENQFKFLYISKAVRRSFRPCLGQVQLHNNSHILADFKLVVLIHLSSDSFQNFEAIIRSRTKSG